jgi:hypothetical protein
MERDEGTPSDAGVEAARERVQLYQEIEQGERANVGVRDAVLRDQLGHDHAQTMRLVEQHISQLPPERRARLANAKTRDGASVLHDPGTVMALAREALGPVPATRKAAQAEIAEARRRLREDRSAWFADDKAQLRFRLLLERFPEGDHD